MKPISKAWCGLIDITSYCGKNCVYCTRNDRHLDGIRYNMTIPEIEKALKSYIGFPSVIGIIGGEPLQHPDFEEVCKTIQKHFSKGSVILFTSIDPTKNKYSKIISETFGMIPYHPHTKEQEQKYFHQPLTLANIDIVENDQLRKELIDDCWVQRKWCPTITNKGAYFCEVGASIAQLLDVKGWEVEPGWWKKTPDQFGYQKSICDWCGMCVPMNRQKMADKKQKISESFLKILQSKNLPTGEYELFDRKISIKEMKEALQLWTPSIYKDEQLCESFVHSTIDWSKYE